MVLLPQAVDVTQIQASESVVRTVTVDDYAAAGLPTTTTPPPGTYLGSCNCTAWTNYTSCAYSSETPCVNSTKTQSGTKQRTRAVQGDCYNIASFLCTEVDFNLAS